MDDMMRLLKRLNDSGVEFVLIGGMAAIDHGGSIVTDDVDVCVHFNLDTITKILKALDGLNPKHRMRPDHMRLSEDPAMFEHFKNLYVTCDLGVIDFLGELPLFGSFDDVLRNSTSMNLSGFACRVLNAHVLMDVKRAVGREKDLRVVKELEGLLWLQRKEPPKAKPTDET